MDFSVSNGNVHYLVVVVLITIIFKYVLSRWQLYVVSWKLPGPLALPLIGNALQLPISSKDLVTTLLSLIGRYEGSSRFWFGPILSVCVRTPADIQIALTQCLEKADFYKVIPQTALFSAPVGLWRKRRKLIQPSFHPKLISGYVNGFNVHAATCAKEFEKYIGVKNFNIEHKLMTCFVHMLCETQYGIPLALPVEGIVECMERLSDIYFKRFRNVFYYFDFTFNFLPISREYGKWMQIANKNCKVMLEKKREAVRKQNEERFLEDKDCSLGKGIENPEFYDQLQIFSEKEIIESMQEFTFAGTDTGTITACSALLMISIHPEVQKNIVDELDNVFADSERSVTSNDIKNLPYLDRVLKESMRLFPIGPFIARKTTSEVKFNTMTIPAGVQLFIPILEVHRSPLYWKNPLKFDPDRFLPEEVAKRHPCCYIPFSAGPRNCVGYLYGVDAVKTTLIYLLRSFTFSNYKYRRVEDIKFDWKFTMRVADGYGLILNKRRQN